MGLSVYYSRLQYTTTMPDLPPLSYEQCLVVNTLLCKKNVSVDAVPGAGKTTLTLNLVDSVLRMDADSRILILSYNRALAETTLERIQSVLGASYQQVELRVQVHTFHSALASVTQRSVACDLDFAEAIEQWELSCDRLEWSAADARVLVVDEGQDMRPDFCKLVVLLLKCVFKTAPVMLVLGDRRQLLYNFYPFSAADSRFLTLAPKLFTSPWPWCNLPLTQSFRCSVPVCRFVSALAECAGHPVVLKSASGQSAKVQLFVCSVYFDAVQLTVEALSRFHSEGARTVMVLCDSMNARSPCIALANAVVDAGYSVRIVRSGDISEVALHQQTPAHQPHADTEEKTGENEERQLEVVFRTLHSAKGLESDAVVVVYRRPLWTEGLPIDNSLYVALTRSRGGLVILQQHSVVTQHSLGCLTARLEPGDVEVFQVEGRPLQPSSEGPTPARHQRRVVSTLASFRFLDVVLQRQLLARVDVRVEAPAIFPTADLYRAPQGYAESQSDSYYYVKLAVVKDRLGCSHNLLTVLGDALYAGVFAALHSGRLPTRFKRSMKPRIRNRAFQLVLDWEAGLSSENLSPASALNVIKRQFGTLVELCLLREASANFHEKLQLTDFSFATHSTVFKRLDRAVALLEILLPREYHSRGVFLPEEQRNGTTEKFTSTVFYRDVERSFLVNVEHSAKLSAENHLAAALDTVVHGTPRAITINLFDGSVYTVRVLGDAREDYACAVELARAAEKPTINDEEFERRFALVQNV